MPGPKGGPGMPEWGMLPIPKKLVKQGVRDMLRISDARMSGTSYGACILHVAPESFVGGPLAFVQTGDEIEVDVDEPPHPSARQRRGTGAAQSRMDAAEAALPAGLWGDVRRAYRAGRRGLRFRLPAGRRATPGAGNPLTGEAISLPPGAGAPGWIVHTIRAPYRSARAACRRPDGEADRIRARCARSAASAVRTG